MRFMHTECYSILWLNLRKHILQLQMTLFISRAMGFNPIDYKQPLRTFKRIEDSYTVFKF